MVVAKKGISGGGMFLSIEQKRLETVDVEVYVEVRTNFLNVFEASGFLNF